MISSASRMLEKIGPFFGVKDPSLGLKIIVPIRSAGKRSGVNWMKRFPREAELDVERFIQFGASPRATISLAAAARAHAFLEGRGFVTPDDVKAMGHDVLRHRVLLTYEAEAEGLSAEDVISRVFQKVRTP